MLVLVQIGSFAYYACIILNDHLRMKRNVKVNLFYINLVIFWRPQYKEATLSFITWSVRNIWRVGAKKKKKKSISLLYNLGSLYRSMV